MDESGGYGVVLLGAFAVEAPGGRRLGGLPPATQRLVAHLALALASDRAAVAGSLWPETTDQQAQACLRSTLWRLHRRAPGLAVATGGTLMLGPGTAVDARRLAEWAEQVIRSPAGSAASPPPGTGELLPGWYDDWVLLERERLRQLLMHAWERTSTGHLGEGRYAEALDAAYRVLRSEPLRESAHRLIVAVHRAEGNLVEAWRAYLRCQRLLEQELGVPPTDQMRSLARGLGPTVPEPRRGGRPFVPVC